MLKVVADTNTLISATIAKGNEYKLLRAAKLGKIRLVLSLPILKEFREVIARQKFSFSSKQIENVFKETINTAELVAPSIKLNVIKEDPDDNMILECAVSGNVDYIVSGDKHLLRLKKFKGIPIVKTSVVFKLI